MKQKILEILGYAFDPEIAEMKAEQIMRLIEIFASMGKREKQIYEDEIKHDYGSDPKICPFDNNYCAILGKSMFKGYVTKLCQNCPRYKNQKS